MAWFRREKKRLQAAESSQIRTEGLWIKCDGCRQIIWKKDLDANVKVCPKCGLHFKVNARERLRMLFDDGEYEVFHGNILSPDPLGFVDRQPYAKKLAAAREATGLNDAMINGLGKLA